MKISYRCNPTLNTRASSISTQRFVWHVIVSQFKFVPLFSCVTLWTWKCDRAAALLMLLPECSLASTHRVGFPVSHLLLPCSFPCILSPICNVCGGFWLAVCVCVPVPADGTCVLFVCVCGGVQKNVCVYVHVCKYVCVFWVTVPVWLQIFKEFKPVKMKLRLPAWATVTFDLWSLNQRICAA